MEFYEKEWQKLKDEIDREIWFLGKMQSVWEKVSIPHRANLTKWEKCPKPDSNRYRITPDRF